MFSIVLSALLPVFSLITLGFAMGRHNLLGEHGFSVLNRFVITITLPVLTFRQLARIELAGGAMAQMSVAVLGGALGIYALAFALERVLGRSRADANIVGLGSGYGNIGFVGLPIMLIVYGPAVMAPAAVGIALNAAIVFGIGILVGQLALHGEMGLRAGVMVALRSVMRSPLILSAFLGVLWAGLRLPIPSVADKFLDLLGSATAPCALVAIGLFTAQQKLAHIQPVVWRIVGFKLLAQPLLTALIVWCLPGLPPFWGKMAILMAGLPAGTSSFLLAGGAGRWAQQTSSLAIVMTTTCAALSLAVMLLLL